MKSLAVVMDRPETLELRQLELSAAQDPNDVLVKVEWTGISTGTERLLFTGQMPPFPGMGYPLVPGYETVGRVVEADADGTLSEGDRVFVPGANCYGDVKGLFGGSASVLRVPAARITKIDEDLGERGVLFALAATAQHAIAGGDRLPELIVGHGVLGRLLARLTVCAGGSPVVWEKNPTRAEGAEGYRVVDPESDERRDYGCICDVSGDGSLLDTLIGRVGRGGEVVLAGFYDRLSFDFPMAFIKEAKLRVAAQWAPPDLDTCVSLASAGSLSLDGLITHRRSFEDVSDAYRTAFGDSECLKMIVDWRTCS